MKVKLYVQNEQTIKKSGIGRAYEHQQEALRLNHIDFTTDHMSNDYDVLHFNTSGPGSLAEAMHARMSKKAVVCHAHSTEEDFKNSFMFSNLISPLYREWLIKLYNTGDVIVTPTAYSKHLLESYGIKKPIYAISNGIDVNHYIYDESKVEKFRNYFMLSSKDKVVVSVGWFFERKGFDTFSQAARALPQYKFIWFGDPQLSLPSHHIKELIEHKPDNLILPGYIKGDVIDGAYMGCDCFFFPSREETEGIVVLEALAAKANVLVRDIGAYEGWLENGVNCYEGKDDDELMSLLEKIVEKQLPDLSEAGYELALTRGYEAIGKQLKEVYEMALKKKEERLHESK